VESPQVIIGGLFFTVELIGSESMVDRCLPE